MPRTHFTPTDAERSGWAQMAQAAYKLGLNAIGHRYSAASSNYVDSFNHIKYDSLMADYRMWLIDGAFPREEDFS